MATVPTNVYNAVEPIAQQYNVPDAIWENLAYYESNMNTNIVGDGPQYGGYSYGLFQLHVADNWNAGGQGNTALQQLTGHSYPYSQTELNLLLDPAINARYAMPSIASAWSQYGSSFQNNYNWWIQFLAASGHPGGNANDPITQNYTKSFMTLYNKNLFNNINSNGTPLLGAAAGVLASPSVTSSFGLPSPADVQTWLQRLAIVFFGGVVALIGILVLFHNGSSSSSSSTPSIASSSVKEAEVPT